MKVFRLESAFARNNHSPKSPASLKKVSLQKIVLTLLFSLPSLALADTFTYVFITGDKNVGHLIAEHFIRKGARGGAVPKRAKLSPIIWEVR